MNSQRLPWQRLQYPTKRLRNPTRELIPQRLLARHTRQQALPHTRLPKHEPQPLLRGENIRLVDIRQALHLEPRASERMLMK